MAGPGPYTLVIYIPTSQAAVEAMEAMEAVEVEGVKVIKYRCKNKELNNQ